MRKYSVLLLLFMMIFSSCGYKVINENNNLIQDLNKIYKKNGVYSNQTNQYIKEFQNWYFSFDNDELKKLIVLALKNNFDLDKTYLNLKAAEAQLNSSSSALLPNISANADISNQKGSNGLNVNNTTLGVTASYELDLWGKNYASFKASYKRLQEKKLALDLSKITVAADMMNLWVNLMTLREKKSIIIKQIKYSENLLDIMKTEYSSGSITMADILNQEAQTITLKNSLSDLNYQENEIIRSINIMIGKEPLAALTIKSNSFPDISPLSSKDLNILVLSNRPDIQSAFYEMIASKYDQKVATLSRLPSINLSLNPYVLINDFGNIFDNWIIKTSASIAMPIFEAGALKGKEDSAKFLTQASIINYKSIVFNAVKDFKTALDKENDYFSGLKGIYKSIYLTKQSLADSKASYLNGVSTYTQVLNTDLSLQQLNLTLINYKSQLLLNRVYIYRSMGINVNLGQQ